MRYSAASSELDRVKAGGLALVFLIAGFILYSPALQAPFLFDDKATIANNELIKDFSLVFREYPNRRFISYLSFALNYAAHELRVYGYHMVNIVLHVISALLVFSLCRVLSRASRDSKESDSFGPTALIAATLFLVHPIQIQSVSYITQRMTILATLFYLLAVILYMFARKEEASCTSGKTGRMMNPFIGFYAGALISAAAAMKSKEIAATLPVTLMVVEWFFGSRSTPARTRILAILPFCALPILLYLKLPTTVSSVSSMKQAVDQVDTLSRDIGALSRAGYALTQIRVLITYVRLLFLPFNQTLLYSYPLYNQIQGSDIAISLFFIASLIWVAIKAYPKHKMVTFGIAWFFISLMVESSVIPIKDVINEHRLYLPSIGFFMACAATLAIMLRKATMRSAYAVVVIVLLASAAYARNTVWSEPERIWTDAISKAPLNPIGYNNLGVVYREQKNYPKAEEMFNRALGIVPDYAPALYNFGDIAYQQGEYEKALVYLTAAIRDGQQGTFQIDVLNKLGRTYGALGQYDHAITTFKRAQTMDPRSMVLINNIGVQYIKAGQPAKAIEIYEQALHQRPDFAIYKNLSIAYAQIGEAEKSKRAYLLAIETQIPK